MGLYLVQKRETESNRIFPFIYLLQSTEDDAENKGKMSLML